MPVKNRYHIPLRDISPEGKSWLVDERSIWEEPLREFGMNCRLVSGPEMDVRVTPVDEGWLIRGRLRCSVVVPCSRCTADTPVDIDESFEDYAQRPDEGEEVADSAFSEGDDHLLFEHGALLLDLCAIGWEQFCLALPQTPLCSESCRGLCARCGADLNQGPCACPPDEGDPRMAVLRGLKVEKS